MKKCNVVKVKNMFRIEVELETGEKIYLGKKRGEFFKYTEFENYFEAEKFINNHGDLELS